jgi:hypothetical protein
MSFSIYTNQNGDIQIPNLTISTNLEFPVGNVRIGNLAGNNNQASTAIAIGNDAGRQNQGISAVALGVEAGETAQGQDCVAVGFQAGRDNQSNNAVAVGKEAGELGQGLSAVAVGHSAGSSTQSDFGVAVGWQAGLSGQGEGAVSVGKQAGESSQSEDAVSVGKEAGFDNQGLSSVAVGPLCGRNTQGDASVAIGKLSGRDAQGDSAVAIGDTAGQENQQDNAVAVGKEAGRVSQGLNSIAIGSLAGQNTQADRTIILNATGVALNGVGAQTDSCYVDPIRSSPNGDLILVYNDTSKEITKTDFSGWTNFNATFQGISFTSLNTTTSRYRKFGNYIHLKFRASFSAYTLSGVVRINLPVPTVNLSGTNEPVGTISITDFSTLFTGSISLADTTDTTINWNVSTGTFLESRVWNTTNPAPYTTSTLAEISIELFYPINN